MRNATISSLLVLTLFLFTISLIIIPESRAQFPEKPITIISPFSEHRMPDVLTRILAQSLESRLRQQIPIENIPGIKGWEKAAQADPDGYKLTIFTDQLVAFNEPNQPTLEAFEPIAMFARKDYILVAHPQAMFNDLNELQAGLKEDHDEEIRFVTTQWWKNRVVAKKLAEAFDVEKLNLTLLPSPNEILEKLLLGPNVGFAILPINDDIRKLIEVGRLKALAVFSEERSPLLSETLTAREQGFDVVAAIWYGLLAPKGTDRDRLSRIEEAIKSIIESPEYRDKALELGVAPYFMDSKAAGELMFRISCQWCISSNCPIPPCSPCC